MKSAVIFLTLISGFANAENWQSVSAASGIEVFVDSDSVAEVSKNIRKAWVVHSYDSAQQTIDGTAKKFMSSMTLQRFSCTDRTSGGYHNVLFSEQYRQGAIVDREVIDPKRLRLDDVLPGSIGEDTLNFVCSQKLNKKK